MTAAVDLLRDLTRSGVRLERRGDRLHIEAPRGAVTPELRLVLTERKTELLAALTDTTAARLLAIAHACGIDPQIISGLPDADIAECAELPMETLRAYALALRDTTLRESGQVPADETAAAMCRHCGQVWIHPDVASVAPVVDGWPRLLGCPWCHVRNRYLIPRPPV